MTGLDFLLQQAKADKQNLNLKTLLMKIILSQTDLLKQNGSTSTYGMLNSDEITCSMGQVNSKTGCIIFQLKSLFAGHFLRYFKHYMVNKVKGYKEIMSTPSWLSN